MPFVVCLFDCSMETDFDQRFTYSPPFQISKRSARRLSWLRFCFCLLGYKHVERNLKPRNVFANLSRLEPQHIQEECLIATETILLWIWLEQSDRLACTNSVLTTTRAFCYFLISLRDQHFQNISYSTDWNHRRLISCLVYLRGLC